MAISIYRLTSLSSLDKLSRMKRQAKPESASSPNLTHLESLVGELRTLEERLQQGGAERSNASTARAS